MVKVYCHHPIFDSSGESASFNSTKLCEGRDVACLLWYLMVCLAGHEAIFG